MIGKNIVVAVLVTFCLTALLFMVVPVGSQGAHSYDPWWDLTGDGKIDIADIARISASYGASGDPTRNVSVTNWPSEMNINITNWDQWSQTARGTLSKYVDSVVLPSPYERAFTDYVSLDGFTKYMLYFNMTGSSLAAYSLCYFRNAGVEAWGEQFTVYPGQSMCGWYDVKGPEMRVALTNSAVGNATIGISIYAVR
ncbi:hypothetical protein MUP01_04025 [Candidatus Bathyarchaeota archaeon]|nr:hypothetical protein [Candidatus Bathyarchaeota archaeon]